MKFQVISPIPSVVANTPTALRATGTQSRQKTADAFTPSTKNQRQGLNFNQASLEVLQHMTERFPNAKALIEDLKAIYPEIPASVSKQIIRSEVSFNAASLPPETDLGQFIEQHKNPINKKVYDIQVPLPKESFEATDADISQFKESYQTLSTKYPNLVKASIGSTGSPDLSLYLGVLIPRSRDAQQTAIASLTHLLGCLKEHPPN
jgi:hypothetical protein